MANVTVYTVYPVIEWASGVAGAGTIYVSGSTFDSSLLSAVEAAAATAGIVLSVGTIPTPPANTLLTYATAQQLLAGVGVSVRPSLDPTGATDYANLMASISANAGAGSTMVLGDDTFVTNGEIQFTCDVQGTPNTVIQAVAGYTGDVASTPAGISVNQITISGGIVFDSNNTARHAMWLHEATHCNFLDSPVFRNSVQDDLVIGDPGNSTYSYGNFFERPTFERTVGGKATGYSNVWLTDFSTDNVIAAPRGNGQEIGIRNDGADNHVNDGHYSNSQLVQYIDTGQGNKWPGCIPDTPVNVILTGATATSGATTLLWNSATVAHAGLPIVGTNIPAGTFIGAAANIVPGTSYPLVTNLGAPIAGTTGTVSNPTLIGVGFNLQMAGPAYLKPGEAIYSTANGTGGSGTNFVVCVGPSVTYCKVTDLYTWGQSSSYEWNQSFTGKVSVIDYLGLTEKNCSTPTGFTNKLNTLLQGVFATLGPGGGSQVITSGTKFQVSTTRNATMFLAVTAAGTLTITGGPSTGTENAITPGGAVTFAQGTWAIPVPYDQWVVVTVGTATIDTTVTHWSY